MSQQENIITEIINIGTWYLSLRANCTSTLVVNSAFSSFNLFTSFSSSVFFSYHAYSISPSFFTSRFSTSCSSSPRAKRTGPKGLRAESARAVTGRQCPHSGKGEDFLTGQLNFFYGNCCNSGTESRKIIPKKG